MVYIQPFVCKTLLPQMPVARRGEKRRSQRPAAVSIFRKDCSYYFTVSKAGKRIDSYYVTKALQLYIEGVSYREIERLPGVSHVSVMNWVKQHKVKPPEHYGYHPTYKIVEPQGIAGDYGQTRQPEGSGMIITELGDKYMLINWERFKKVIEQFLYMNQSPPGNARLVTGFLPFGCIHLPKLYH